uniref:Secreted protein n=2 Tax=Knipowitschia caucasica TaxID=637954 RepID=A0AAV2J1I4_KNICA
MKKLAYSTSILPATSLFFSSASSPSLSYAQSSMPSSRSAELNVGGVKRLTPPTLSSAPICGLQSGVYARGSWAPCWEHDDTGAVVPPGGQTVPVQLRLMYSSTASAQSSRSSKLAPGLGLDVKQESGGGQRDTDLWAGGLPSTAAGFRD